MTYDLLIVISYAVLALGIGLCVGFLLGHLQAATRLKEAGDAVEDDMRWVAYQRERLAAMYTSEPPDLPPEPPSEFPRLRIVRGRDYN